MWTVKGVGDIEGGGGIAKVLIWLGQYTSTKYLKFFPQIPLRYEKKVHRYPFYIYVLLMYFIWFFVFTVRALKL